MNKFIDTPVLVSFSLSSAPDQTFNPWALESALWKYPLLTLFGMGHMKLNPICLGFREQYKCTVKGTLSTQTN